MGGGRVCRGRTTTSWLLVSSTLQSCWSLQRVTFNTKRIPTYSAGTTTRATSSLRITSSSSNKCTTTQQVMLSSLSSSITPPPPPPLIDVDCNLWHDDMQQSLLPVTTTTPATTNDATITTKTNESATTPFSLHILEEDAVMENNIVAMISPSSTLQDAVRGLAFLESLYHRDDSKTNVAKENEKSKLPLIRTTVGVHPYHVNDNVNDNKLGDDNGDNSVENNINNDKISKTMQQARDLVHRYNNDNDNHNDEKPNLIVAIGECGLDASPGFPPLEDQLPWFQAQVELAQELQLPLFVHERLAVRETLQILDAMTRPVPVLIHCFTGGMYECQEYVQRGYYLSFSGYILKSGNGSEDTRQCLRQRLVPLSKLMIETDAPYMGFPNCRNEYIQKQATPLATLSSKQRKRLQTSMYPNVPSSLVAVLDQVVALLNHDNNGKIEWQDVVTREEVAYHTTQCANEFFGLQLGVVEPTTSRLSPARILGL